MLRASLVNHSYFPDLGRKIARVPSRLTITCSSNRELGFVMLCYLLEAQMWNISHWEWAILPGFPSSSNLGALCISRTQVTHPSLAHFLSMVKQSMLPINTYSSQQEHVELVIPH